MRIAIIIIGALGLLTGCNRDKYCKVTSDTRWEGTFGDKVQSGNGTMQIDLPDKGEQCVQVQKLTRTGTLTIQLFSESHGIMPSDENSPKTTTSDSGSVSDCID